MLAYIQLRNPRSTVSAKPVAAQEERQHKMPVIAVRPTGAEKIRRHCAVIYNQDLANHIGVHAAQVSRVLSGKHKPGNQFIAGVIELCGLKFAFDHVFEIKP